MNERRTLSMLQRLPVILAVTAASYGLPLHTQSDGQRTAGAGKSVSRPAAADAERPMRERGLVRQR